MMRPIGVAMMILAGAVTASAQGVDPQGVLDDLLRQHRIENRQQFEDRQRERRRQADEAEYDGRMCASVGYPVGSPAYFQCIRDSADYRRRGASAATPPHRRGTTCTTVGSGGLFDTLCD